MSVGETSSKLTGIRERLVRRGLGVLCSMPREILAFSIYKPEHVAAISKRTRPAGEAPNQQPGCVRAGRQVSAVLSH